MRYSRSPPTHGAGSRPRSASPARQYRASAEGLTACRRSDLQRYRYPGGERPVRLVYIYVYAPPCRSNVQTRDGSHRYRQPTAITQSNRLILPSRALRAVNCPASPTSLSAATRARSAARPASPTPRAASCCSKRSAAAGTGRHHDFPAKSVKVGHVAVCGAEKCIPLVSAVSDANDL